METVEIRTSFGRLSIAFRLRLRSKLLHLARELVCFAADFGPCYNLLLPA